MIVPVLSPCLVPPLPWDSSLGTSALGPPPNIGTLALGSQLLDPGYVSPKLAPGLGTLGCDPRAWEPRASLYLLTYNFPGNSLFVCCAMT